MTTRDSILAARVGGPHQSGDGVTAFEFRFEEGDRVFAGHFPGRPILPGVFQIEMGRISAAAALGCELSLREIRRAKFQRPIVPGETVLVELRFSEKDDAIQARAAFFVEGKPAGETVLILWRSE